MDDTDIPDPVLKQIPLIKNPSFQPPRPITLNSNYNKLLPNLFNSVIPPKINLSSSEIKKWIKDIDEIKEEDSGKTIGDFENWLKSKQLQIAPGFEFADGIMKPSKVNKRDINQDNSDSKTGAEVNELDELFGKSTLQ